MKKRGQVSIEFITIFGFIFIMTLPLILIYFDQNASVRDSLAQNQARNIAIKIADKAESVYYSGEPSKATIKVYMPDGIEFFSFNKSSILVGQRGSKGRLNVLEYPSLVNLTFNISTAAGIHFIEIEAGGGGVSVKDS